MVVNKYLAEFLGTFVLVFFGSMGILAVGGASVPPRSLLSHLPSVWRCWPASGRSPMFPGLISTQPSPWRC